jgi:hypothetical protein
MFFRNILIFLVFWPAITHTARPLDPWVIRGVMTDNKYRLVIIALHESLSAVYEATSCGLYMTWAGGVQDGNATYRHGGGGAGCTWTSNQGDNGQCGASHHPQGPVLHKQDESTVWTVSINGSPADIQVNFEGYYLKGDMLTLWYTLRLPDGRKIDIKEIPEYDPTGQGLSRAFTFSGIEAGLSVSLSLNGATAGYSETWQAEGSGQISNGATLTQTVDGQTTVTGTWRAQ